MDVSLDVELSSNLIPMTLEGLGMLPSNGSLPRLPHSEYFRGVARELSLQPPLAGGPMFFFLFQLPCYFRAEDADEVLDNVDVAHAVAKDGPRALGDSGYPTENWYAWDPPWCNSEARKQASELVGPFRESVQHMWETHLSGEWSSLRKRLRAKADAVVARFEGVNPGASWAHLMGRGICESLSIRVSVAGPSMASSSGMDVVVTAERFSTEQIVKAVVHETGVRFIPLTELRSRLPTEASERTALTLMEAATCYIKTPILEKLGLHEEPEPFAEAMQISHLVRMFGCTWNGTRDGVIPALLECHEQLGN